MTDPSLRIPKLGLEPAQPVNFPGRGERQAARQKRQADEAADIGAISAMYSGRYKPQSNIGKTEMKDAPIKPSDKGVWGRIWDSYQNVTQGLGAITLSAFGQSPVDFIPDELWRPAILNILELSPDDPNATLDLTPNPAEQDRITRTKAVIRAWTNGDMRREDAWQQ